METVRIPWWKSLAWFMASIVYGVIAPVLSLWVGLTLRHVLGDWIMAFVPVLWIALIAAGYRQAANHGFRLYKYAVAVTIGSGSVLVAVYAVPF